MKNKTQADFPLLPPVHTAHGEVTEGALLLEGGSFRGIYSAGVCDVLMEQGIHFQTVAGVSAGALNGLNVMFRQVGRFASICLLHREDSRYTGVRAILQNGGLMGFRFLFDEMERVYPVDRSLLYAPERRFVAFATDCKTGEGCRFDRENCKDLLTAAKASASLAIVSRMVSLDGKRLLDGGYSTSVPLQWAIEQGYPKRVAVLTRDVTYRKGAVRKETMQRLRRLYHRYPRFCDAVENLPTEYAQTRSLLEQQMRSGETFVICPQGDVDVSRLEKDTGKMYALYLRGRADAEKALPALRAYLETR